MAQAGTTSTQPGGGAKPNRPTARGLGRLSTSRGGRWRRGTWRRGWILAAAALLTAAVLLFHDDVPNSWGNLGSLLETFLPWVGVAVPLLLLCALLRRSAPACLALVLPVVVWAQLFGDLVTPGKGGGPHNLRVLTHNVDAANADPARTARDLIAADADVIALEEVSPRALPQYQKALAAKYPHRVQRGTVALWSRYRVADEKSVDVGIGWTRALRARVETPRGPVAFYVAHLASVRVGSGGFGANQRNTTIRQLGDQIAADAVDKVVLMGDLNGTANDRSLSPITSGLRSAQGVAGDGFGFSWPAGFPMARIDHILVRGVEPAKSWVLPDSGSDHRPVAADLEI